MEKNKTITDAAREIKVTTLTLKKWEKENLISIKKEWSQKYKEKIRYYSEEDMQLLKWIARMSKGNRSNFEYLRLLIEYIKTGRINTTKLRWPPKNV